MAVATAGDRCCEDRVAVLSQHSDYARLTVHGPSDSEPEEDQGVQD